MSENEHSRTIKLRAWDISGEQMIYLEGPTKLSYSIGDGFKLVFGSGFHDDLCDGHVSTFDLMLFIGLTDKNGKDVYEGDIVTYLDNTSQGLVKKITLVGDIRYLPDFGCSKWEEVIGNMHETPELLKQID